MPKQRNYTNAEDRHLVQMWLYVSQDPAVGNNQSKAQFWKRIVEDYHSKKPSSNMSDRNVRSVQCHMQLIHRDCKKFNGCL
ncbi:hypothetical protein ACS0TY_015335 [Phlomoides rotata]